MYVCIQKVRAKKFKKNVEATSESQVPEGWHEASPTLNTDKYWAPWYKIYSST
jgi:hypothetical protein